MNEQRYQIYLIRGFGVFTLLASDMLIDDAILFVKALFDKYYNESPLRIEIRRSPKEEKYDDET